MESPVIGPIIRLVFKQMLELSPPSIISVHSRGCAGEGKPLKELGSISREKSQIPEGKVGQEADGQSEKNDQDNSKGLEGQLCQKVSKAFVSVNNVESLIANGHLDGFELLARHFIYLFIYFSKKRGEGKFGEKKRKG